MRQVVGANLIGLYLHGSLAMGCFNPNCSDLDVIAVTAEGMAVETKRAVAAILLQQSGAPHPIEVSFLRRRDLAPWRYPTPFDFHYKEGGAWAEGALPSELQLVIRQALVIYRGESVDERFAPRDSMRSSTTSRSACQVCSITYPLCPAAIHKAARSIRRGDAFGKP